MVSTKPRQQATRPNLAHWVSDISPRHFPPQTLPPFWSDCGHFSFLTTRWDVSISTTVMQLLAKPAKQIYETVRCPSVRLSVPVWTVGSKPNPAGLLSVWLGQARDIDRLLQQRRVAGECGQCHVVSVRRYIAEHGLVISQWRKDRKMKWIH